MTGVQSILILNFWLVAGSVATPSYAEAVSKESASGTKAIVTSAVQALYQKTDGGLLWYCSSCESKRFALLDYILHSDTLGLQPAQYIEGNSSQFRTVQGDEAALRKADERLSAIVLQFSRDLYAGANIDKLLSYDEVSPAYVTKDISFLVSSLSAQNNGHGLIKLFNDLQPGTQQYAILKRELRSLPAFEQKKRMALLTSMSYYRWLHHFNLENYIVVNIPSAALNYFHAGKIAVQMRAIVGTPDSRTPRLATHIRDISLYPYWNMPRSIMSEEWFDLVKDNRAHLDYHELQIIDSKGAMVPYESIKWKAMNSKNFPYRIRQKAGCANPLGVVRFGMSNPFDIYLHDTPGKAAFDGERRYYSHGCVRVENAPALAGVILPAKIDHRYLAACFSDQQPQVLPVPAPVPVFIVYVLAEPDSSGRVVYHPDVYKLAQK